jgi:hypothetical protein
MSNELVKTSPPEQGNSGLKRMFSMDYANGTWTIGWGDINNGWTVVKLKREVFLASCISLPILCSCPCLVVSYFLLTN